MSPLAPVVEGISCIYGFQVLAAQTRLARELHRRPELYEVYLIELLTLFADKGVAIQNLAASNHHTKVSSISEYLSFVLMSLKTEDMTEQLASLLLPIDALLSHGDLLVDIASTPSLVNQFRNMWFLCILFQFTASDVKDHPAMAWQKPALARIAIKTPPIVVERSHDSIASDLEYNPVIRQEYVETVSVYYMFPSLIFAHFKSDHSKA